MKRFIFLTFVSLICSWSYAQEIIAQHNDKGMYVVHTVAPKENFYSLGRLYNIPPKEIAAYNNLLMESGLNIGQTVNIPLSTTNFSQANATSNPVYYVVGEKEGLYRVSVNNNKVLMANLRKWNNLQSDAISAGQKLIVGYLVTPEPFVAASQTTTTPAVVKETPAPDVKSEVVKKEPVQTPSPAAEKKQEPRAATVAMTNGGTGYFKADFEAQIRTKPVSKDEVATAGIFKTASGWQDAKYYALIDGIEPGTIIKVVNPDNGKAIYAKVLDKMTGIRQNSGYNIRISNAAATALDITDTEKFIVRVNY